MNKRLFALTLMLCLLVALMAAGCATKAAKPAEEVTPPAPPKAVPAETGPEMKPTGPATPEGTSVATPVAGFDKKIFFDFDKFDLKSESLETLNELAAYLKNNAGIKVKVEGHCDERGTIEYNLALGERRAKMAMDYLASQGIDAARLSTISYGKEKPVDPAHTEEAWSKNRRDEFVLTK